MMLATPLSPREAERSGEACNCAHAMMHDAHGVSADKSYRTSGDSLPELSRIQRRARCVDGRSLGAYRQVVWQMRQIFAGTGLLTARAWRSLVGSDGKNHAGGTRAVKSLQASISSTITRLTPKEARRQDTSVAARCDPATASALLGRHAHLNVFQYAADGNSLERRYAHSSGKFCVNASARAGPRQPGPKTANIRAERWRTAPRGRPGRMALPTGVEPVFSD